MVSLSIVHGPISLKFTVFVIYEVENERKRLELALGRQPLTLPLPILRELALNMYVQNSSEAIHS